MSSKEVWKGMVRPGEDCPVRFTIPLTLDPSQLVLEWELPSVPFSETFQEPTSGAVMNLSVRKEGAQ